MKQWKPKDYNDVAPYLIAEGGQSVIDFLKTVFAAATGAEVAQEPKTQAGDPDKRGGVKDPSGNTWWISTQQSS